MKIVGLTGGIGSGKSTIAKLFQAMGVPVFIADTEAKKILASSKAVQEKVISLLGAPAYSNDVPNRDYIAKLVFNDPDLLAGLNAIIHPQVHISFMQWVKKQAAPYCIKEAAILFESGGYKNCDAIILVIASEESRIQRVLKRDKIKKKDIEARIRLQWSDDKKKVLSDYLIQNEYLETALDQAEKILNSLLNK